MTGLPVTKVDVTVTPLVRSGRETVLLYWSVDGLDTHHVTPPTALPLVHWFTPLESEKYSDVCAGLTVKLVDVPVIVPWTAVMVVVAASKRVTLGWAIPEVKLTLLCPVAHDPFAG